MGTIEIRVDREACASCDVCAEIAPGTFELDVDAKCHVKDASGEPVEKVIDAAQNCPLEAITVIETESGRKIAPD